MTNKEQGEQLTLKTHRVILEDGRRYIIVSTSLYDSYNDNHYNTMVKLKSLKRSYPIIKTIMYGQGTTISNKDEQATITTLDIFQYRILPLIIANKGENYNVKS